MQKRKKYIRYLYASFLFLGLFDLFIFLIDPQKPLILATFHMSPIPLFFVLTSGLIFFVTTYVLCNIRRGIFAALFVCIILLLRLFEYTSPLYIIILFLIFICLEIFIKYLEKSKIISSKNLQNK